MRVHIVVSRNAGHQIECAEALVRGMRLAGDEGAVFTSEVEARKREPDAMSIWGWRKGHLLRQAGWDVLLMERAFVGDRFKYCSLGWNGLNGRAI